MKRNEKFSYINLMQEEKPLTLDEIQEKLTDYEEALKNNESWKKDIYFVGNAYNNRIELLTKLTDFISKIKFDEKFLLRARDELKNIKKEIYNNPLIAWLQRYKSRLGDLIDLLDDGIDKEKNKKIEEQRKVEDTLRYTIREKEKELEECLKKIKELESKVEKHDNEIKELNNKFKIFSLKMDIMEKNMTIPKNFYCSIGEDVMLDPVKAPDGHTYERVKIEKWLSDHDTSPLTGKRMPKELMPDYTLKGSIDELMNNYSKMIDLKVNLGEEVKEDVKDYMERINKKESNINNQFSFHYNDDQGNENQQQDDENNNRRLSF